MGSITINNKVLFDRPSIRPQNYTDMIQMTRDLKKELKHQLLSLRQEKKAEEAEIIRRKEIEKHQKSVGFTQDAAYGLGGQCAMIQY